MDTKLENHPQALMVDLQEARDALLGLSNHASNPSSSSRNATSPKSTSTSPEPSAQTSSLSSKLHSRVLTTLLAPLRAYGRAQQSSPYLTQLLSSLTIYTLGDLSAQNLTSSNKQTPFLASYDPFQTLRAMLIGAAVALPAYHWFLFLGTSRFSITLPSRLLPLLSRLTSSSSSSSAAATSSKLQHTLNFTLSIANRVITNQLVFTPLFLTYFFTAHALLTPLLCAAPDPARLPSPTQLADKLAETVPRGFVNSWRLWPAVTAVSFTVVQPQYRAVFAGVVAVGWQTYLGILNLRAREGKGEGEVAEEVVEMIGKGEEVGENKAQEVVLVSAVQREGERAAARREGSVALATKA
ncbi:MAG: hypothetical protein Q9165_008537 [Trypethelium subeluteriae]